ncbi:MAG: T9SS type A sorting domain-containing protein [Bacteroidota bacterium]
MRSRFLYIWLLLIICQPMDAQQLIREVIGTTGTEATAGNLRLRYTLGEAAVSTRQSGTTRLSEGFYQALPLLTAMVSDSVWPGDTNNDGVANNSDLLAIGLAFGANGPVRVNASLNWNAQFANNWVDSLPNGVNYKYADTDGNGSINLDDTLAIDLNYGLTHNKGSGGALMGPALFTVFEEDTVSVGEEAHLLVFFGTDNEPVQNVYGMGCRIEIDSTLAQSDEVSADFSMNWMGVKNVNLITLGKNRPIESAFDLSMVGIDQIPRTGSGMVARITIIVIDDLSGKTDQVEKLVPQIMFPEAINRQLLSLPVQIGQLDTLVIVNDVVGIEEMPGVQIDLYPNPARDQFEVSLSGVAANGIEVYDLMGKKIMEQKGLHFQQRHIDCGQWPAGMYTIRLLTQRGILTSKLLKTQS